MEQFIKRLIDLSESWSDRASYLYSDEDEIENPQSEAYNACADSLTTLIRELRETLYPSSEAIRDWLIKNDFKRIQLEYEDYDEGADLIIYFELNRYRKGNIEVEINYNGLSCIKAKHLLFRASYIGTIPSISFLEQLIEGLEVVQVQSS